MADLQRAPRRFLPPLLGGAGLGLALYGSFLLTGHGLGAYGFFRDATASLAAGFNPFWTAGNAYLSTFLQDGGPLSTWIAWEVAGVGVGALAAGMAGRRLKFRIERGRGVPPVFRLFLALLGGALTSVGAALARGCTSGLGLSGAAVLSAGAFVFLLAFFLAGVLAGLSLKKLWR